MLEQFALQTERLRVRELTTADLPAIAAVLDATVAPLPLAQRRQWLAWTVASYRMHDALGQLPYGERAVVLKDSDTLIGAVGVVPAYGPFGTLAWFAERSPRAASGFSTPEVGLFWAIAPLYQRQGYATEAAAVLMNYLFQVWQLERIVAITTDNNIASLRVMQHLGMQIERTPHPAPAWFQVVGVRLHPALTRPSSRP